MAMRVTQRSGRVGSAKHNDRSFLQGRDVSEVAPHIDADRLADNRVVGVKEGQTMEEAELAYYEKTYSAAINARNEAYIAQRHAERCKTVEDVYHGRLTRPEETILQIGNMKEGVNVETLEACFKDYLKELTAWNQEHGNHMRILNFAVHADEQSPHIHMRRVWEYTNERGFRDLGQNQALREAGVPLPDPEKPESRYNNRKMTFDAMMRERWQEICKSHGLEIEKEPRPARKHLDKADYIAEQKQQEIQQMQLELNKVQQQLQAAEKTIRQTEAAKREYEEAKSRVEALECDERILSAAKVEKVSKNVKTSLLHPDEYIVPKKDFESLVRTARGGEAAQKEAHNYAYERRKHNNEINDMKRDIKAEGFQEKANRLKAENTLEKLKELPEGVAALQKLEQLEKLKPKIKELDMGRTR